MSGQMKIPSILRLKNINNGRLNATNDKAPWLWIISGAALFALIFTGGYSARHLSAFQTSPFYNTSLYKTGDSKTPAIAAAVPDITSGDIHGSGQNLDQPAGYGFSLVDEDGCRVETVKQVAGGMSCLIQPVANSCKIPKAHLCHGDLEIAKTAWQYFENNYHPETGLVNSVDNYPSTTMWDTGSSLAATITANDIGLIDDREFDQRIMAMFKTLSSIQLFNGEAPNKVYNTKTIAMVDYGNQPTEAGIGISILDLARLASWLNTLNCMHPQYHSMVNSTLSRWDYSRLFKDGSMYGMALEGDQVQVLQEGRLGYEQYAGKIFNQLGFDLPVASSYENEYRTNTEILGIPIAHDTRDPRQLGANNYVVTESYAMDAMELGVDEQNEQLLRNIFEVQKKRWQETGIVTAISEDNIDQEPWFLYNSIFNAGLSWQTTNSSNTNYDHLKTISVKAALSMAMLFPDDEYSKALTSAVQHAYDPERGWYSGIYENGAGYNTAITANTNGMIMSSFLFKKFGAIMPHCTQCAARPLKIDSPVLVKQESEHCEICTVAQQ